MLQWPIRLELNPIRGEGGGGGILPAVTLNVNNFF